MYGPLLMLIILTPLFFIALFWAFAPYKLYKYHDNRLNYVRPGCGDMDEFYNMKHEIRELKEAGRDEELAMIKKMLNNKPFVGVDYGNLVGSDTITAAEAIDFDWSVKTESITATAVACTRCLVCGEDVILLDYEAAGPRVCSTCKKAIKFIKEKFREELDNYEV
jgi:hypothetical protein